MNTSNSGEVVGSLNDTAPSFVIYYGEITESSTAVLSSYDIAVVEPKGTSAELNKKISSSGTKLFAYMSTLGVEGYDQYKMSTMKSEDFMVVDDERVHIESFDNYIGDIRSIHFQDMLLDLIDKNIVQKGYDGVFLDTVDFTEYFDDEALNDELQVSYIEFLKRLHARYPDLSVFQNRGFQSYFAGASQYVDYLLYEDFRVDRVQAYDFYKNLIMKLSVEAKASGSQICALSLQDELSNLNYANDLEWSYYYSSYESNYLSLPQKSASYYAMGL